MAKITIKELQRRFSDLIKDLEKERNNECLVISNEVLALVKRRIINKKVLADGEPLGNYSEALVPYWFYQGKETNRDNAKAVAELFEKKGYFASYKDWREINNLPTDAINLSFTNKMWNTMKAYVVESKLFKVAISFKPTKKPEQDKLGYHLERWPDLFRMTAQEIEFVKKANTERRLIYRLTKFKII